MKTKRMRMLGTIGLMALLALGTALQMGCTLNDEAAGALIGAGIGGVIGHQSGHEWEGATLGGFLGQVLAGVGQAGTGTQLTQPNPVWQQVPTQPQDGNVIIGTPILPGE